MPDARLQLNPVHPFTYSVRCLFQ